jgi:hypothetical protein
LSWCQAPFKAKGQNFVTVKTVAGLLMCGAISDERTGLSLATAAGPHQHSHCSE